MGTDDHRSRTAPIAGVMAAAYAVYALPGLARGAGRRCARALGVEDRTADGSGYALTFDDGPHAEGTPAVLDVLARERVARRSSSSASRSAATRRCRGRSSPPGMTWLCTATVTATCCGSRPIRCARTSRAPRTRSRSPPASPHRSTARPTGFSTRARSRSRAGEAGARCCGAIGGATGRRGASPESIAALVTGGAGAGSVLLLHDADDYSAPGSWRRTVAALPARDRDDARARARSGPPLAAHAPLPGSALSAV